MIMVAVEATTDCGSSRFDAYLLINFMAVIDLERRNFPLPIVTEEKAPRAVSFAMTPLEKEGFAPSKRRRDVGQKMLTNADVERKYADVTSQIERQEMPL